METSEPKQRYHTEYSPKYAGWCIFRDDANGLTVTKLAGPFTEEEARARLAVLLEKMAGE